MKILVLNYTFDASAKQITFTDYNPIVIERVLLITNITDNIIIYNFADPTKGGTATTNVLTLTYDTTSMSDTDKLQIFYDDASTTQPISGTVTANAGTNLNTSALATSAKQDIQDTSINSLLKPASTLAAVTTVGTITNVVHVDDNAGSLTVDGSVTANAGTNLNTSALALEAGGNLASIKTNTDKIPALGQALAAASVPVILPAATITTLTPPAAITGFATETTLGAINNKLVSGTDIGDVTINNTTATPVPVQPPASGFLNVSIDQTGNNNAVDVLTIAAGNNNIGDVDIASIAAGDNNIGNVDVLSVIPGVSATNLGKAEDSGHTTGDVGVMMLGVRNESNDDFSGTDKDYVPISTNAKGNVMVVPGNGGFSATVSATNLDIRDLTSVSDSVQVLQGTATNLKSQAECYQGGAAVAAGNPLQVSLANHAANATAVKVNVASGGIASGSIASGAIAAGAIASGNTSIATTEDTPRAGGEHLVKIGLSRLDTPVADANVSGDGDYTNFIGDNFGALWVDPQGNVAHDSADAGRPIKIGGRASTTPVTAVAANDRVDAFFDVQGRQIISQKSLTGTVSKVDSSATNVTLLAANTARLGATIVNNSTSVLYIKFGATASTTSFTVKMVADAYYEVPFGYYGIIDGIWSSANGSAIITELT